MTGAKGRILLVASTLVISTGSICFADINGIAMLYRSLLSRQNETSVPGPAEIAPAVGGNNFIRDASEQQLATLLPLAGKCLESSNPMVRKDGLLLLDTVAIARLDNATLLAPYYRDVSAYLDSPDYGMKNAAIGLLAKGYPKPSAEAISFLRPHLTDKTNSADQFLMISGALLIASPQDRNEVGGVLTALRSRDDQQMLGGSLIQSFGVEGVTTPEALEFMRSGLTDGDSELHRVTVEAIGRLPRNVRSGFTADLLKLLANPGESEETINSAKSLLLQ